MLIFQGTEEEYDEKAFVPVEVKAGANELRFSDECIAAETLSSLFR